MMVFGFFCTLMKSITPNSFTFFWSIREIRLSSWKILFLFWKSKSVTEIRILIVQWQQLTGFLVIRRRNSQCVLVWWKTQNRQPPRTIMLQTDHHSSITTKRIFAFLRHAETIGTNNWNFSTAFWGNGLYTIKNKQTTPPNKQSNKCGSCSACLWHTRKKICPIYLLSLNY